MSSDPFVLGIDFGGTKIAVATADVDGRLRHREEIPTLAERGADQALQRAIETGRELIERTSADHGGELSGVGVATMGVTLEDRVLMSPNVPGWDHLAIPPALRKAFSTDAVRVENDVKAAASAEVKWGALAGVDIGIYLNLGTGIATALIVDGHVVRGAHGAAGEIAYNLRHPHDEIGVRHGHAPLEEFVGGGAIAKRAKQLLGETCTPSDLFQRAESSAEARAFVEATLSEIAFHLTNLTIAVDPRRIVIGGGLLRSKDVVLPRLEMHLQRFVPFPPDVVEAHFSLDAGLMGAIAVALEPMLVS